ncbi:YSIRK-type signal peptide-containing protein [Staphylococcus sp. EZ-P03]|nr:YSIRK-type signal peptide-containing protein [Staphylococcus sp. EZ-P03]
MKEQKNKLISDASRRNRYSIRKFTVGAASIVVGATVLV